jgi:hypothetical protein
MTEGLMVFALASGGSTCQWDSHKTPPGMLVHWFMPGDIDFHDFGFDVYRGVVPDVLPLPFDDLNVSLAEGLRTWTDGSMTLSCLGHYRRCRHSHPYPASPRVRHIRAHRPASHGRQPSHPRRHQREVAAPAGPFPGPRVLGCRSRGTRPRLRFLRCTGLHMRRRVVRPGAAAGPASSAGTAHGRRTRRPSRRLEDRREGTPCRPADR